MGALGVVKRVFSSVGLERYLDRVKVGGSNPSTPTKNKPTQLSGFLLIQELSFLSFIFCIIDQKTIAIPAPKLIPKEIPSPILSKTLPKATPNEVPILVPIPINNPILF